MPSSFSSIRSVSVHVVHSYSNTLLGKNCVSFYRSRLTSIWPIAFRELFMPLLVTCCCLSLLMRHSFLGRWTCLLVSENYRLVRRCRLFDKSTCILSCLRWHGGLSHLLLVPTMQQGFGLGGCICQKRYFLLIYNIYTLIYIYIYTNIKKIMSRISLALPRHPSLSSIAPGMSSRLHPVSAQNCCI